MFVRVYGTPAPQGSKTAVVRGGRAVMFESNKKLPAWRDTCLMTFKAATTENLTQTPILGALKVTMNFYLERPRSNLRHYPNHAPDLDKLARGVNDALQESGLISNDGQIVELVASKFFADEEHAPGVEVDIYPKK